jgi:hypothetical protein
MPYKLLLLFSLLIIHLSINGQVKKATTFINPTGSYKLDSKTEIKDGDTYGYFGEINVKLLKNSKIAFTLFVCKGAPSYNSGTIWDTLNYQDNVSIYKTPEDDSTCKIVLIFKKSGITIKQHQADLNFGCGFGHGVFADGFYKKTSSKIPIIKDPAED